jgi:hypothetical protein
VSYVFDNSPLSALFRNYYRKRFPSLWQRFDQLVADGRLVSTREAFREIEDGPIEVWSNGLKTIVASLRHRQPKKARSSPASMPFRIFSRTSNKRNYCGEARSPIHS